MRAPVLAVALAVASLGAAACHHHRDLNAPGTIDPSVPPVELRPQQLEYPGDPGERMVVLTTGVVGGAYGGSIASGPVGDFAIEATVSWGESETTHNDRASRLIMPRGVLLPAQSDGVTLGWSGLRIVGDDADGTRVVTGPIYAQVQRAFLYYGGAVGLAVDPRTGGIGPQVDAFYTFCYLRGRVLFGDGWELGGGLQIKWPTTWVWSR